MTDTPRNESARPGRRHRSVLPAVGGIVFAVLIAFLVVGWRSITVERAGPNQADRRFAAIRSQFSGTEPLLRVESDGRVERRQAEPPNVTPAYRLRVLAYRSSLGRVVQADMPFWFVKLKAPAIRASLLDTGLDLDRLGLTPTELQRYGATLVLDELRQSGDRLLVWME